MNLRRHIENLQKFGITPIVALNHFVMDTPEEIAVVERVCDELGARCTVARHWAEGGMGAEDLAKAVKAQLEQGTPDIKLLYPDDAPLETKVETVAREIYRAAEVVFSSAAASSLKEFSKLGYGDLPVCIAKTQYSFSTDLNQMGRRMDMCWRCVKHASQRAPDLSSLCAATS